MDSHVKLPRHQWDTLKKPCLKIRPTRRHKFYQKLLRSGLCTLVPYNDVPTDHGGKPIVGGFFGVGKKGKTELKRRLEDIRALVSRRVLQHYDRLRKRGSPALVTFEGITTLVDAVPDNGGTFTDVSGGGLTGQSSYAGSFTGAGGSGEGNLAGARITVIPGDPGCEGDVCDGGIGDCGEAQSGPGCGCSTCEEIVCEIDPICCEINWDSFCANLAENNCGP